MMIRLVFLMSIHAFPTPAYDGVVTEFPSVVTEGPSYFEDRKILQSMTETPSEVTAGPSYFEDRKILQSMTETPSEVTAGPAYKAQFFSCEPVMMNHIVKFMKEVCDDLIHENFH